MEVKYFFPDEESTNIAKSEPNMPADIGIYDGNNDDESTEHRPLQELSRTTVEENQVCYINGKANYFFFAISFN